MGASSSRPSTTSREVAFRSTEKKQHGTHQFKASGRVCIAEISAQWTRAWDPLKSTTPVVWMTAEVGWMWAD